MKPWRIATVNHGIIAHRAAMKLLPTGSMAAGLDSVSLGATRNANSMLLIGIGLLLRQGKHTAYHSFFLVTNTFEVRTDDTQLNITQYNDIGLGAKQAVQAKRTFRGRASPACYLLGR